MDCMMATRDLVSGVLISMVLLFSSACFAIDMPAKGPEVSTTKTPNFGMMQRFVGQKFVSGNTFLEIADEDQGQTLIIKYGYSRYSLGEYRLRTTAKRGRLQNVNNPKSDIYLDDDGVLTIKDFDKKVFRVNDQQLPSVDNYRREYGAIWDSHNFDRRLDFVVLNDDNERIEKARKLADDQQRREAERAKREASLETARAWAGAFSGAAQAVTQSTAQMAPTYGAARYTNAEIAAGARESQKFAQERQKQGEQAAQAASRQQAQEQAQEQASEQQRQTQAYNAQVIAEKKQAAQEHLQAEAQAQAERKAKLVAQQRAAKTAGSAASNTGTSKSSGPGYLIVNDDAFKAQQKLDREMAESKKAGEAAEAAKKARYAAESARYKVESDAAQAEMLRKMKERGRRQ
jgi:hypothetical protein